MLYLATMANKSDHDAKISREEQQEQTVDAILQMTEHHKAQKHEEEKMVYRQITPQEAKEIMDTENDTCNPGCPYRAGICFWAYKKCGMPSE